MSNTLSKCVNCKDINIELVDVLIKRELNTDRLQTADQSGAKWDTFLL